MVREQKVLPYSPVSRATLQDHVYTRVRELILNGGVEPGRTVTVQSLSDAFDVSAMPVREALQRLVAERALTVVAGRSVGIPPLTLGRLTDLTRVRAEIEGTAMLWAAEAFPSVLLDALSGLIERMEVAKLEDDRATYVPANREFHFTIYRAAGSDALLSAIESLWLQISPHFNVLNPNGNWRTSNLEHRAMRDALAVNDGAAARRALLSDIEGAFTDLRAILVAPQQPLTTSGRTRRQAPARRLGAARA